MFMTYDLDRIITFMKKFTAIRSEIGEQDAPADTGAGGGTTGTATSGKTPKKWESGRAYGKTHQPPPYSWESGRTFGKTYMNDPKYKWTSGRNMGKTGGSDYA